MDSCSARVLPEGIQVTVAPGTSISDAIQAAGIALSLPCGGRGVCGRCKVNVSGKPVKACVTPVEGGIEIDVPEQVRLNGQNVLTDIRLYDKVQNKAPRVERIFLPLAPPTLEDSLSDASRLKRALAEKTQIDLNKVWIEPSCLPELPAKLRACDFTLPVVFIREKGGATILSISSDPIFGIAADIGTTTIVVALCDLAAGEVVDTVGIANPQAEYGSDVISRIVLTEEDPSGLNTMHELIVGALSGSIRALAARAGIGPSSIPSMAIAANTVMSHFLLGLPADYLRREPYVPVAAEYPDVRPSELGLPILPCGRVHVIAGVSSYVGGDITSGVIATGLQEKDGINMLVDLGTNGEIALAGAGFTVACSSSAGPAFEGSGISCGSRAMPGAVDNVSCVGGDISFRAIGGAEPVSLCGSGLISLLSALLRKGVIDRSGHFLTPEKLFRLTPKVSITEDDVLNLIRAKGAVFAGMRVISKFMGLELADISKVLVAGGFGRSLDFEGAVRIGLLPQLGGNAYEYVGNSALAGALRVLCDRTVNDAEVAASIMNLELSIGNEFMDEFVKACFLPHTDLSLFQIS